jgi:hypothetical protein
MLRNPRSSSSELNAGRRVPLLPRRSVVVKAEAEARRRRRKGTKQEQEAAIRGGGDGAVDLSFGGAWPLLILRRRRWRLAALAS